MTTELTLKFTPASEAQKAFLTASEKYVAYVGGLGSGKTHGGAVWAISKMLERPGARGLIAANTYKQLNSATMAKVFELLREYGIPYKYNSADNVLRLQLNGYTGVIECRTLHGSEYEQLAGIEYSWAWVDEAAGTSPNAFQRIRERVRQKIMATGQLVGHPVPATNKMRLMSSDLMDNPIRITTTPDLVRARWLYDFLRNPEIRRALDDAGLGVREINAPTRSNAEHLSEDYIRSLEATLTPEQIKQQLLGEWVAIPDGKPVYGSVFLEATHLKEHAKFNPELPLIIGIDWGFHRPAAVFAQEDSLNRVVVLGEYIGEDKERTEFLDDLWQHINTKFLRGTDLDADSLKLECYCDPAGKQMTDQSRKNNVQTAREHGFKPIYPVTKKANIEDGVNVVRRRLNRLIEGGPALTIAKYECPYLIEGLQGGYHYPKRNREDVGEKVEPHKDGFYEHLMDALRYLCVGKYYRKDNKRKGRSVLNQRNTIVDELTGY